MISCILHTKMQKKHEKLEHTLEESGQSFYFRKIVNKC